MYIPASFEESDLTALHDFIDGNGFGLLVSQHEGKTVATHLPFLLERDVGPSGSLVGHVARANPQWRPMNGQNVLSVFSGAHAYISPSWYESDNVVPTWNYAAVHVYGKVELIVDPEPLLDIVRRSVDFYEASLPVPWGLPHDDVFIQRLLQQIVGFRIAIESIEGKWKLSQNHAAERRQKVVHALEKQHDENSRTIASWMRQGLTES